MNFNYIEDKAELRSYLKNFEDSKQYIMALDIEAESNLHAYGEKLCLIQVFDGINKIIIDPFKIDNYDLKLLFENRNFLKVMYDASGDLSLLKNANNIDIKSILDLRPAVELLNYDKQDLHSVIASELGVLLENKKKYQRNNWTLRPISEQALDYATNDVIYLLRLKDILLRKLYESKLLDSFLLKNLRIQNKDHTRNPEHRYRNIKGYNSLQSEEKALFRQVVDIREKYAKACNMPAHNVINRTDLFNITKDAKHINEISFPKKFSTALIDHILHDLRMVIEEERCHQ
ncbi:hypothetical protein ACFLVX_02500 [Chloroflexota bacterium]